MTGVHTVNPATEELLKEYAFASDSELEAQVRLGGDALLAWRDLDLESRSRCLADFETALHGAQEILAEMITMEMGKVMRESRAEVAKGIDGCRALRENFPSWLAAQEYVLPSGHAVYRRPLGQILGIMPWNFPLWQVLRFSVPAILAGNSVMVKHAPSTWGVAEFVADLFRQTFPAAVFQNLRADIPSIARLIADRRVRGISLTGSREAGASVAKVAGLHIKKCVLELGGNDAYVVLGDADIELAARVCASARLLNAGQSCVAAKRFIVVPEARAEFTDRLTYEMAAVKFGNPTKGDTGIGPLARADLRQKLHRQVQESVSKGAKVLLGGEIPDQSGFYYPPTVLSGVGPGQPAFDDELFGPVAAVIEARDESHAFRLANESRYGLGGAVFSRDVRRAKALALNELDAGMVFVNDSVKSTALVPFGGIKDSGIGCELGPEGSLEFTHVKVVQVGDAT